MDTLFKIAAVALIGLVLTVLVKQRSPEMALALGLFTAVAVIFTAFDIFRGVKDALDNIIGEAGLHQDIIMPVWKTCVIAIVTKITAELCRDAKESAVASGVETAGAVLGLFAVLPLFSSLFDIMRSLL
jgi:stage III sporulation protein AD